jgi:uridine kinase
LRAGGLFWFDTPQSKRNVQELQAEVRERGCRVTTAIEQLNEELRESYDKAISEQRLDLAVIIHEVQSVVGELEEKQKTQIRKLKSKYKDDMGDAYNQALEAVVRVLFSEKEVKR